MAGSATSAGDGPPEVERYGRWQWSVPDLDLAWDNPFDPDDVRLDVTFHGPGGLQRTVPGFFDGERFTVRFTPERAGPWTYRATARARGGERHWHGDLAVREAGRRGFMRLQSGGLRHETGEAYTAIGENVCWGSRDAYTRWFERLAAAGGNYARLWMAPWGFALEWKQTPPGDYRARLGQAADLDAVFDLAERRGIALQLCLLNHGQFSTRVNPEWADNPWNAACPGGFLQHPQDFFTDARAQTLFERRLRYIVARWGYAPHLLAWELWNEVELTDGYDSGAVAAWHARMAGVLRALDPHRHLVTTSYARPQGDPAVWRLPGIDFVQVHRYGFSDVPGGIAADVARARAYGKPVLYGEFGLDAGGPDGERDPQGVHLHRGCWAGLLSGSLGTAMTWWWDNYVDPLGLYPLWSAPASFSRDAFGEHGPAEWRPVALAAAGDAAGVLALAAPGDPPDRVAAWVWDRAAAWQAPASARERSAQGVALDLGGLPPASWRVAWGDTHSGAISGGGTVASGPGATLAVPAFSGDVALLLRRQPG